MARGKKVSDKDAATIARFIQTVAGGKGGTAGAVAGITQAAGGGVGSALSAVSEPLKAYFQAEATKEVARQQADASKTVAAVGVNADIMHELDRPVLVYESQRRRSSTRASLSILSLYFMGSMMEKAHNSIEDVKAGRAADNFSKDLLMIRAPLQAIPGKTQIVEASAVQQAQEKAAAAAVADSTAAMEERRNALESFADFLRGGKKY